MEELRLSPKAVHKCHVCKLIVKTPLDNFFIYAIKKITRSVEYTYRLFRSSAIQ